MGMKCPNTLAGLAAMVHQFNSINGTNLRLVDKAAEDSIIDEQVDQRLDVLRQMMADCSQLALHDEFGMAAERLHRFMVAAGDRWDWMIRLAEADYKSVQVPNEKRKEWYLYSKKSDFKTTVPILLNTQKKVDGELRAICGQWFIPWADRYGDEDYREE